MKLWADYTPGPGDCQDSYTFLIPPSCELGYNFNCRQKFRFFGRFIVNTARPRNNLVYLLIVVAIGAIIFTALRSNAAPSEDVPLSEVAAMVNAGKVKELVVSGDDVRVDTGSEVVTSHKDTSSDLASQLNDLGVDVAKLATVKYIVDRPPEWGS